MNKIKFSQDYPKLWGQVTAELIAIKLIKREDFPLTRDLIDYDTKNSLGDYYPLSPRNNYLQLIFLGNKKIPFCTIRRYTEEKAEYYSGLIGQQFEIKRGV